MKGSIATNFEKSLAPMLNAALDFALNSEHSAFYRNKYKGLPRARVEEYAGLARLPFLERAELVAVSWRDRLFVPESDLAYYAITSGTTDSPRPFVIPRLDPEYQDLRDNTLQSDLLRQKGINKIMVLLAPFHALQYKMFAVPLPGIMVIPGDPRNIGASAAAAAELGVNGFVTTSTALMRLVESYEQNGFDTATIKWASLGGEATSRAKYDYLRSKLPAARLTMRFGAAELGGHRYYRCEHLQAQPDLFHPIPDSHIFEIISPSEAPCAPGETGELVHTDLTIPNALPFIRYRTGDEACLSLADCPCGAKMTLRLSGKLGFDTFRYAGVQIRTEMVERALLKLDDLIQQDFRLHIYEREVAGKPVPALELQLIPKQEKLLGPAREELAGRLAALISSTLYLAPKTTLEDLVKKVDLLPLKVELVDSFPLERGKPRRMIPHL